MEERIYTIKLSQSAVNLHAQALNEIPTKFGRPLLNDLEAQVMAADQAEAAAQREEVIAEHLASQVKAQAA